MVPLYGQEVKTNLWYSLEDCLRWVHNMTHHNAYARIVQISFQVQKKKCASSCDIFPKNFEPTSSEIHDAPRHIVNPPLLMSIISSIYSVVSNTVYIMYVCMCVCVHKCAGRI